MKTKLNLLFILFLLVLFLFTSIRDAFAQREEIRNVDNFSALHVSGPFKVSLSISDTTALRLEGESDLLDDVVTEVRNGVLKIYVERGYWRKWQNRDRYVHISLSAKLLSSIHISAGTSLEANNTIKSPELHLKANAGSSLKISVETEKLELNTLAGAFVHLSGKARQAEINAIAGSNVQAYELESSQVIAKASAGSYIQCNSSDTIEAHAKSGSDIRYKGEPAQVRTFSSLGGSIVKR
jgi:hypothetical protein